MFFGVVLGILYTVSVVIEVGCTEDILWFEKNFFGLKRNRLVFFKFKEGMEGGEGVMGGIFEGKR